MIFNVIQAIGTICAILFSGIQIKKDYSCREMEQASGVTCWMSKRTVDIKKSKATVEVMNGSSSPIYNVVISIDCVHYDDKQTVQVNNKGSYVQVIPPGHYLIDVDYTGGAMHTQFSPSIHFTDSSGKYWYRNAWGKLKKVKMDSLASRNVNLPVSSEIIEKVL